MARSTRARRLAPRTMHHETLDHRALPRSLRDLVDIGKRDPAVRHVLGLLHDRDPALAKIETARRAGADAAGEPLRLERVLEAFYDLLRALLRARAFRVVGVPAVDADEEIAFAVRHSSRPLARGYCILGAVRP